MINTEHPAKEDIDALRTLENVFFEIRQVRDSVEYLEAEIHKLHPEALLVLSKILNSVDKIQNAWEDMQNDINDFNPFPSKEYLNKYLDKHTESILAEGVTIQIKTSIEKNMPRLGGITKEKNYDHARHSN